MNEVIHDNFLNNKIGDKSVKLIIADPPYYKIKGEFDYIWKTFEHYLADVELWVIECKRILANNGSLFWWGHPLKIAYSQIILDKYFHLENSIVWEKIDAQTRKNEVAAMRTFAPVTERLLFYSNYPLDLIDKVQGIREYLRSEIMKSKGEIVLKTINEVFGTSTSGGGMASSFLSISKEEPGVISKEMYQKLQNWCYPFMSKDYEVLRQENEVLNRAFIQNKLQTDVLRYSQETHVSSQYDHETQKPEKLTTALIETCSREGDLICIPFAGSGTECAMSARAKRPFIAFDIEKKHVDTSNKRCKNIFRTPTLF